MSPLHDFALWEPLLRLLRSAHAQRLAAPGGQVVGRIGRHSWSVPLPRPRRVPGRALQTSDNQEEHDAVERLRKALHEADVDGLVFALELPADGSVLLRLLDYGPAVDAGSGYHRPATLRLVEGARPEPWRRLPEPVPGARPAPSADPALLERILRERLPDAIGATEEEITAAEVRLGLTLPEEVKALYRVTRERHEDSTDDLAGIDRALHAVGFEPNAVEHLFVADTSERHFDWAYSAMEAARTDPDAAVQDLAGSPGWIVLGLTGNGDRLAVDLTPGPRGHLGQIIVLSQEEGIGAVVVADSLTALVTAPRWSRPRGRDHGAPPQVARVHHGSPGGIGAAARPELEVLGLGACHDEPFGLAPLLGLPRLRSLSAYGGSLADPSEIGGLTGLEFLELTPADWRAVLAADAVPAGLLAAGIDAKDGDDLRGTVALANEILARWNRPLIGETVLRGDLGPLLP
ncbi:SMI1/KNR4 family protein [Kitasatospora sp. NPDC056327]|uniref:SMI1/KNR4 family protein n=1 Tax=Kitasatospora sp. NPDC056327 TaxID=3345785 RepID=UPI0035DDB709